MRAGCLLAKSGSEYGQVAQSCENGNEHSNSIRKEHEDSRGKICLSTVNIVSGVSSVVGNTTAQ